MAGRAALAEARDAHEHDGDNGPAAEDARAGVRAARARHKAARPAAAAAPARLTPSPVDVAPPHPHFLLRTSPPAKRSRKRKEREKPQSARRERPGSPPPLPAHPFHFRKNCYSPLPTREPPLTRAVPSSAKNNDKGRHKVSCCFCCCPAAQNNGEAMKHKQKSEMEELGAPVEEGKGEESNGTNGVRTRRGKGQKSRGLASESITRDKRAPGDRFSRTGRPAGRYAVRAV